jgi:endo-1,4-beta-xylanase
MKIRPTLACLAICLVTGLFYACKKSNSNPAPGTGSGTTTPPPANDSTPLKTAATGFAMAVGINYSLMNTSASYASVVKSQFNTVTFEYEMKHGAIVQNDGSYNFTNADELLNLVNSDGLNVYGHTLAWYQNNNGSYLRSLLTTGATGPTLIQNGSFEQGTANTLTNWFTQVSGGGVGAFSIDSSDVQDSSRGLECVVTTPGAQVYNIQAVNDAWTAVPGHSYKISFFAKSIGGGSFRAVSQGTVYYEQLNVNPTSTWTEYDWTVTPTETAPQVKFQFGTAGTYFIDHVTVSDPSVSTPPSAAQITANVDSALKNWITTAVTHFKGKVTGWDAVNEAINDGTGSLRNNPTPGTTTNDTWYWAEYLGRGYVAKAFQYAHAADASVPLFINDYNLESDAVKLDSLLELISELKAQNVPISGVATQMHISINTPTAGIDQAFQKLAATGLKVKVSELDVRIDPGNTSGFSPTDNLYQLQATMYHYVASSYLRNVPAAQRFGMTVWDVTDNDSWIVTSLHDVDYPTMFDGSYNKKPAFYQFLAGLEGK